MNFMTHIEDNSFFIKKGYVSRSHPSYFTDNLSELKGITHQPHVYPLATFLARKFGCNHIIDIGCGKAKKLVKLHPEFSITGVDIGPNIEYCRNEYDFGEWLEFDFEQPKSLIISEKILKESVIICSDVIEHLENPSNMLTTIKGWMNYAPICLLSTPERDLVRGKNDNGPPDNPHHIREWNLKELEQFHHSFGFQLLFVGLTASNDQEFSKKTSMLIIEKNRSIDIDFTGNAFKNFRVLVIMTAYNEEDIISQSIHKLLQQGINVHVIENWSTDNTFQILKNLEKQELISLERFPLHGPSKFFDLHALLTRVEQVSREIKADWYIHHDVDEIRTSPWPDYNLKQGIFRVDQEGYNSIDHNVIFFQPIDDGFIAGTDFESYFKYFEFCKMSVYFLQIKAWKNYGQDLSLADSGGHEVKFDGRKVYPYKFLLKHYPFRTKKQSRKKVFVDRKSRWNPMEKKKGWHAHYDHIDEGFNFLKSPSELELFNVEEFNKKYLVERLSSIRIWKYLDEIEKYRKEQKNEIEKYRKELYDIKNSKAWKLLQQYIRFRNFFNHKNS